MIDLNHIISPIVYPQLSAWNHYALGIIIAEIDINLPSNHMHASFMIKSKITSANSNNNDFGIEYKLQRMLCFFHVHAIFLNSKFIPNRCVATLLNLPTKHLGAVSVRFRLFRDNHDSMLADWQE